MVFLGFVYKSNDVKWRNIYWIDGEKTKYSISNIGLVRNDKTNKIIKTSYYKGYERVNITHNGISKSFLVHRLVAIYFIPNPKNKPEVNHKDGVKDHNYDFNLEWATGQENIQHAYATGLNGVTRKKENKELTKKEIQSICKILASGSHMSFVEIARIFDTHRSVISRIYHRKSHKKISEKYDFSKYRPNDNFSLSGDDFVNTKYSDEDVHKVCKLIDSGKYTLREIEEKTNIPYQTIRNIYYGTCRNSISSQYNFAKTKKNPLYEDKKKEVIKACELLDKGYNTKQVSEMVNLSRSVIRNIYSGYTWVEISKDYNFYKTRSERQK